MFNKNFICIFLFFGITFAVPTQDQCKLNTGRYSFFAPLIFNEDGSLLSAVVASTDNKAYEVELNPGQKVILSCAPNYFNHLQRKSFVHATCVSETILSIDNENKDYINDLACDLRSIEEVLVNVRDCTTPNRGVQYGFTNPIDNTSYIIGESCFSTSEGRTLFVHIKLRNNTNTYKDLALKVENEHFFKQAHPSNRQRIDFLKSLNLNILKQRILSLYGREDAYTVKQGNYLNFEQVKNKQYNNGLKFIWNEQLIISNHKDFNNLDILQKDIDELGVFKLEIYTGSHGVISLPNTNGNKIDFHLVDKKYPVPKYIWTLVKSEEKAVVFIYYNNPKASNEEIQGTIPCGGDKCSKLSWATNLLKNSQYKNIEDGFLWCCELKDVKSTITEIPDIVDVTGFFK